MVIQSEFENRSTEEFTVNTLDNGVVIGELHQRENPSQQENERFNQLLDQNKDSIFVLESDPSNSDIFTEKNSPPTFMSQALEFAKKNNIQVEIMDDERISKDRYGIWQEAGTDFSQQDFEIINTIYIMRMGLNVHNISFEQVVNNIQNSEILDEGRKQTYFNSFSKYIRLLQSEDRDIKLENIDKLIHSYLKYDAICRERYYQKKIANIIENNPGRKIFAVFGKSHTQGISNTIEGSIYLTPLPSIAKMKWLMASI